MSDHDGPAIAKAVYNALFNVPGGPNLSTFPRTLARVVDDVVRDMRAKGVSVDRWAAFVHIGA